MKIQIEKVFPTRRNPLSHIRLRSRKAVSRRLIQKRLFTIFDHPGI
jgi:hypothetical protein